MLLQIQKESSISYNSVTAKSKDDRKFNGFTNGVTKYKQNKRLTFVKRNEFALIS